MSLLQILTDPQNFRFYAGGRGHVSNAGSFGQTSIPYGNDTQGGGSSGQPYIQIPIPDGYVNQSEDFLLRNGYLNPRSSIQDVSRLTKMFFDLKSPNGLLFIAKQQLLSATAPRTQTSPAFGLNDGVYSPLNTLAEAGIVSIGGHLRKQGINPLSGTGAYSNDERLYGVRITNKQDPKDNRLVQLTNGKLLVNNKADGPDPQGVFIMKYSGGPGSVLGIGNTLIRIGQNSKTFLTSQRNQVLGSAYSQNTFTFDSFLLRNVSTDTSLINPQNPNLPPNFNLLSPAEAEAVLAQVTQEPNLVPITNKNQIQSPKLQDFRKILRSKLRGQDAKKATDSGATPEAPDYSTRNYEQNFNFNDPGQRANRSYANYSRGVIDLSNSNEVGAVDKINALPIYKSEQIDTLSTTGKDISSTTNDFVKFAIAAIDNNNPAFSTFIHFRALLDSFNDSYNASWNSTKYLGRGENFYTYDSFTRTVSLSFTAVAQSKQELIPMYKKLNYLASQLTPDYSPSGYMRGPLVKLTVGGYLYEQPGFIQGLSYDLITDAPWEIGINTEGGVDNTVKQLSQMVKVTSFTFIPIHNFVPSKQGLGFSINGVNTTQGPQRYIALENAQGNNYNEGSLFDGTTLAPLISNTNFASILS